MPPSIDVNNAELDPVEVFKAFKHQIDTNKTVLACFAGWSISASASADANVSVAQEPDIRYYNIDAFTTSNEGLNETYTQDSITDGEAIGHTVCVVGYIEAGTVDDPQGSTNWLIVRIMTIIQFVMQYLLIILLVDRDLLGMHCLLPFMLIQ